MPAPPGPAPTIEHIHLDGLGPWWVAQDQLVEGEGDLVKRGNDLGTNEAPQLEIFKAAEI